MSSTIDGLVSGLSTSSLISSLMQVEAAPQNRLKTKVSTAETVVTAYQSVNSKLAAIKTAADSLGQLTTWRGIKATSSSTSVTATASGGLNGVAGNVTFDVQQLASAQTQVATFSPAADVVINGKTYGPQVTDSPSFTIKVGDTDEVTLTLGDDKSLKGISELINAKGAGVRSTVLTTGNGDKILKLTSAKTGEANAFTIGGLNLTDPLTASPVTLSQDVAATDAVVSVQVAGGYTLKSPTNTFTDLMPGVTVTATKVETGVTLTTAADVSGITAKMQALVEATNAALGEIETQTAYNPAAKKGSPLTGDFAARQLSSSLLSMVSRGLGPLDDDDPDAVDFGSLSQLGIQLDRSGRLTFEPETFTAAYNADPTKIKIAGTKLADAFETFAGKESASITATITGRKTMIDSLNAQIDNWSVRLSARQVALQKQYAGLETSLSKLQSQSTWLSGQIASLG